MLEIWKPKLMAAVQGIQRKYCLYAQGISEELYLCEGFIFHLI